MLKKLTRFVDVFIAASLLMIAAPAGAQTVATIGKVVATTKTLTKASQVAVAAAPGRMKWCAEAVTTTGAVPTDPIWLTASSSGGVTQTARTSNAAWVIGGSNPLGFCDDGSQGGVVYSGAITVISLGTSSAPQVKITEWRR